MDIKGGTSGRNAGWGKIQQQSTTIGDIRYIRDASAYPLGTQVRPHQLIGVYLESDSSKVLGLPFWTRPILDRLHKFYSTNIPQKQLLSTIIISLLTYIKKTKTKPVTSSKSLLSRMGEKTHSQKPHTEPWQRDRAFHRYCPGGNSSHMWHQWNLTFFPNHITARKIMENHLLNPIFGGSC